MNTQKSNDNDLLCASMILQGLLASGHFTASEDEFGDAIPSVKKWDAGKNWKENGATGRFEPWAVGEAWYLLGELKTHIDKFTAENKPK